MLKLGNLRANLVNSIRDFKRKRKITIIDISCKFYLQNNNMTYTYGIKLTDAIFRHQKLLLICKELPTVALSYHVKIRENH